tara:strand:- start:642 stop:1241 length:600 start_codon:yes stop_codon:yes gene_type:complete
MTVEYLVSQNKKGRQLLFDLDNTIYLEKEYLFRVYKKISKSAIYNEPNRIYNFLERTFINEGRKNLFNKLLIKFPSETFSIDQCLAIMRNFQCDNCIDIFPWFRKFLSSMDSDFVIKIITNGTEKQQKNKINSINFNWPKDLIEVVYASSIAPKPEKLSFFNLKGSENFISPIYIGDSSSDELFAKNLDIEFYNVKNIV